MGLGDEEEGGEGRGGQEKRRGGRGKDIPARILPAIDLLPVLPEAVPSRIDDDLVVPALKEHVLPARVQTRARQWVHVRLGDELDGDGDVDFPGAEGLIVRGGDEAAVFVDEGDGVDGAEVVVVFLGHAVVAAGWDAGVELDDFLVGHAG